MKRNHPLLSLLVLGAAGLLLPASPARADDDDTVVPGEVVVKLRAGASVAAFDARYAEAQLIRSIPGRRTHLFSVPVGDEEETVDVFELDADVEWTEPNFTGRDVNPDPGGQGIFVARSRADYLAQPSIAIIGSDLAHAVTTGQGASAAIIDSGLDTAHPELAGAVIAGGWNFLDDSTDVSDAGDMIDNDDDGLIDEAVGHGTLAAGVFHRVAPDAGILPLKVLNSDGIADTFRVAEAMYYAMDRGITILNLSLGTTRDTAVLIEPVLEARSRGVVVVAAVGNDDTSSPTRFPAALSHLGVIAVAATTDDDLRAPFSNFGPHVSLSAPGVQIVGTTPDGGYGAADGTSFGTPLVTGTIALLRAQQPDWPARTLSRRVLRSARPIDALNPGYEDELGSGRLDALRAVLDGGLGGTDGSRRSPRDVRRIR